MELRRWHQDAVQPVDHQSTSPKRRKCVQQKWSSTGKTADAVRSAFQTAGRWWPSASAGTRSACRNRHKLVFRSRDSEMRVVRILAESLLWEERLGKTRIRMTEGLTTCMEPHRGWTINWNFLRKRWWDREQELITVIQEETKRTEEKEEAGYRSPTWSIYEHCKRSTKPKDLKARR